MCNVFTLELRERASRQAHWDQFSRFGGPNEITAERITPLGAPKRAQNNNKRAETIASDELEGLKMAFPSAARQPRLIESPAPAPAPSGRHHFRWARASVEQPAKVVPALASGYLIRRRTEGESAQTGERERERARPSAPQLPTGNFRPL